MDPAKGFTFHGYRELKFSRGSLIFSKRAETKVKISLKQGQSTHRTMAALMSVKSFSKNIGKRLEAKSNTLEPPLKRVHSYSDLIQPKW